MKKTIINREKSEEFSEREALVFEEDCNTATESETKSVNTKPNSQGTKANSVKQESKKDSHSGILGYIAKMFLPIILVVAIVSVVFGILESTDKSFSYDEMTITLNASFKAKKDPKSADMMLSSDAIEIWIDKNPIESVEADLTATEYINEIIETKGLDEAKILSDEELSYFTVTEYDRLVKKSIRRIKYTETYYEKENFIHKIYVFRSDSAYWVVDFVVNERFKDKYTEEIIQWAKTVRFE